MTFVKVKILDSDETRKFYGSDRECEEFLHRLFPEELAHAFGLVRCIDTINKLGFAEVTSEPVSFENNLLPPNYLEQNQGDDPWVREADLV